ncbi:N-acetylmannosamine-6-phosphate 2-epimerase [Actinocatenispora rupis]|uniref:N-acylglucosamine-6-phosphate 2-epimerase n=1 Tax=Actinocatenispora rupis TaxID=519421 RepID=A0A8J3IXA6_9ACTN|nr:putative N-acetylmannosamine-6-phosphate 2-epimerase [Actinocatenispora rupis]GID10395.1 N-acylglucosamine-6-phosphate 2-epimerase [Actinocatenispora rupis]
MDTAATVKALDGGLIVSCQAPPGHPLRDTAHLAAVAECARDGGATGLRLDADDVAEVRRRTVLPIIGIRKHVRVGRRPLITPTYEDCVLLAAAGSDIVAVEATAESPGVDAFADRVARVHTELGVPVMADVATRDEGLAAWDAGADLVGTTLSGYTAGSAGADGPDLDLVERLAADGVRVVLEGRVSEPAQVRAALDRGAYAVVVGKAITDPLATTVRFAAASGRRP